MYIIVTAPAILYRRAMLAPAALAGSEGWCGHRRCAPVSTPSLRTLSAVEPREGTESHNGQQIIEPHLPVPVRRDLHGREPGELRAAIIATDAGAARSPPELDRAACHPLQDH